MRHTLIPISLMFMLLFSMNAPTLAQDTKTTEVGPTLNSIFSRREVNCGVNQDLPGFGYINPNTGDISGFDVDFCRAVAAAVLGDATLVNLMLMPTQAAGEEALRSGDIDVLMRNVNWTLTDDAAGLVFGPINFYNGDTIMVRAQGSVTDWPDLDAATICVVTGSTAESHLIVYMQSRGLTGNLLAVTTLADGQQALDAGRCDALSSDLVQLTALRERSTSPEAYIVWQNSSQFYTREPFAPVMRSGDDQWNTIVDWTVLGLIQAEQLGISSENIQSKLRLGSGDSAESDADYVKRVGPDVAVLFDQVLGIGGVLGLQSNFMLAVIMQVGNYGEIYDRHLGPRGELPIDRGLNNLQQNGGLIYAPDWR
jgi:general L-amino acid transport system substrate-binding protein